jgi:hypothetical protein
MRSVQFRVVIHLLLALLIFGVVSTGAQAAPAPAPAAAYHEECDNEGCNTEEVRELWNSFQHECFAEGCWYEEVRELAGGTAHVDAMFAAFRRKLGKEVEIPTYRPGSTPTFWAWLCETFGSGGPDDCRFIVKTPPIRY